MTSVTPQVRPSRRPAFTLIELLVSMAVLVVLMLMIVQMGTNALSLTTNSRRALNADSQVQVLFNRMADDFEGMFKRGDADAIFLKSPGNDCMYFYSQAPAYFDNTSTTAPYQSPLALLGYRINTNHQLERLGRGLTWDNGSAQTGATSGAMTPPFTTVSFLNWSLLTSSTGFDAATLLSSGWPNTIGVSTSTPPYNVNASTTIEPNFQVISESAFRFEFCFLLQDGTYSNKPLLFVDPPGWKDAKYYNESPDLPSPTNGYSANASSSYIVGSRWFDTTTGESFVCTDSPQGGRATWSGAGMMDVKAIVVAVVLLDAESTKTLSNSATVLTKATQVFVDPTDSTILPRKTSDLLPIVPPISTSPPILMGQKWNAAIADPEFPNNSTLPRSVASRVRVYQRTFSLHP